MNNTYIVSVGRQPELTIAELINTHAEAKSLSWVTDQQFLRFDSKQTLTQSDLDKLGMVPELYIELAEADEIEELLSFPYVLDSKKFALNFRGACDISQTQKQEFLKTIKNSVPTKTRYLNKPGANAPNALIIGEGFLNGNVTKFSIIKGDHKYHLLKTIGLQNINSYSHRDYKKPHRDMQRGMFPPKLAQFLINLTPKADNQVIYDPFCGIGTVAIEADLQNIPTINSDIDEQAIRQTRGNLEWIQQEYPSKAIHTVFVEDATTLDSPKINWAEATDIVTEGYLGNIVKNRITHLHDLHDHKTILETYTAFLTSLKAKLQNPTTIILCVPCYLDVNNQHIFYEKLVENIKNLGYNPNALLPGWLLRRLNVKATKRHTLVYMRPQQNVGREIFRLEHIPG